MLELPQRHLSANVLTHRNKRDPNNGKRLECIISIDVVVALVQHPLDFQDVTRPSEGADLNKDECLFCHGVRYGAESLYSGV